MAEMGYSLNEVTSAAKEVAENMGKRLLVVPYSRVMSMHKRDHLSSHSSMRLRHKT